MIIMNEYPVCEYDTSRNPIIKPTDFLEKTLPSKCVITFFQKELNQFVLTTPCMKKQQELHHPAACQHKNQFLGGLLW